MTEVITPDGSAAPVILDATPVASIEAPVIVSDSDEVAAGIAKLVALGLTEDEARAIAGMPPAS